MKKFALAIAAVIFFFSNSYSQINKGNWELSFSGDMGEQSSSTEVTGNNYHEEYDGTSENYLIFAIRAGYFVTNGLEIEPEFMETAVKNETPCFSLGGNAEYNFQMNSRSVIPFILAGYGVSNAIPFSNVMFYNQSGDLKIGHWNLGAGIKILVSKSVGLRIEYRHQQYNYDEDQYGVSISSKLYYNKILFGMSLFL